MIKTPADGAGRSCVTIYLFTFYSHLALSRLLENGVPVARACVCAWFRSGAFCRCKSPRVGAKINKQTCVRKSAHAISQPATPRSTCSAAGGAVGCSSWRMLSRWFMQRPTFLQGARIKKFFRGKNEHAETPCLRINPDFSKKIIKKRSSLAAYGIKSWLFDKFSARPPRALTSSASSVAIISWFSLVFLPGRKSAPLLINRVTHGEWSVDGIFICECDSHALCGCLIKISPMLTGKWKKNNKTREVDSFFWYFWSWAWLGVGGWSRGRPESRKPGFGGTLCIQ